MINFIIKNLDSFIISTIFLILGFLPTIFDSKKLKHEKLSFNNSNINNSNIGNTYNQNHTENNYNNNTVVINHDSTTTSSDPWIVIILGVIFLIPLMLFYKHIDKILAYSITITISCLLLSLLIYKNLIKISSYIPISNNILNISIRNIVCWSLVLTNYITIFYKVNFSSSMKPFIYLINNISVSINNDTAPKVIRFLLDNPYEGSTAIFIIFSFLLSMFLISKLFFSYIWIVSSVKISINPNNKIWFKIYNSLDKRESNMNKKCWVWFFIILFSLSTSLLAYALNLFINKSQHHKV
ncbi:hypothetical protein [Tissierella praeacuta]|uniref:hypothetical protein n=1 Tax=Tissierella praeacuta TaxID=43131 RepID=UPI0028AF3B7A|nr:hypothetical protein [Tissierella praeacuta]